MCIHCKDSERTYGSELVASDIRSRIDPAGLYSIRSFLRMKGNPNPIFDISPSTWWAGVNSGRFPKPAIQGKGMTRWRGSDLLALADMLSRGHRYE